MVIIELFDSSAVENIINCIALTPRPDTIIYVGGDDMIAEEGHLTRFVDLINKNGKKINLVFRYVEIDNLLAIKTCLRRLWEDSRDDDIHIDLTGGSDLVLVAAGMFYQELQQNDLNGRSNIQMHRFRITQREEETLLIDCDGDGNAPAFDLPYLDVEQNLALFGGSILNSIDEHWDFNTDFTNDINNFWQLCCNNPHDWNNKVGSISQEHINRATYCNGRYTVRSDSGKQYHYKDRQTEKLLLNSGLLLELKTYRMALDMLTLLIHGEDEDKSKICIQNNYIKRGVMIDWDGIAPEDNEPNTLNEIDVLMMYGIIPVFISCKNGNVDEDELYKLDTVARRFGGKYARKLLVCTSLKIKDKKHSCFSKNSYPGFRRRAEDMGIKIVELLPYTEDGFKTLVKDLEFKQMLREAILKT